MRAIFNSNSNNDDYKYDRLAEQRIINSRLLQNNFVPLNNIQTQRFATRPKKVLFVFF